MPASLIAVAVGAYAWWVTGLAPFSAGATVAVVGAGLAAALVGHRRRPRAATARVPPAGLAVWAVLVAALAAWQLVAYFGAPRSEHPTLSSLTNAALDGRLARSAAFAAWLAGAAWLGRR